MGITKTLTRLSTNFFWNGMRDDVHRFVLACLDCQHSKYETKKSAGLLCPLPIPHAPWEDLSLDFIVGLPSYQGHTTILVVVDRFSKGIHLGMLQPHYTAYKVALLFMDIVGKIHGMPRSLVSDRDPLFVSRFWQELFKLSGTKLRMSSSYHPQTDGQTEVLNRVVEQYLRAFVHTKPSSWGKYLMWAEWSYNTSQHSGTGKTPFEITFGKPPPTIPQYLAGTSTIYVVDDLLANREAMLTDMRRKLAKAQHTMKASADAHRRDVQYKVGDWVLVKLRPHRQTSVTQSTYSKLHKRYYGPFQVLDKIGSVAYKVQLPPDSKIHPVFHCSVLKPYHHLEATTMPIATLPPDAKENQPIITPLVILDSRWSKDTTPTLEVLVQWSGLPADDTSWEQWDKLKLAYHLEDKVLPDDVGSDSIVDKGNIADVGQSAANERPKRKITMPKHLEDFITMRMPNSVRRS
jgi:ribosomal protein L21E